MDLSSLWDLYVHHHEGPLSLRHSWVMCGEVAHRHEGEVGHAEGPHMVAHASVRDGDHYGALGVAVHDVEVVGTLGKTLAVVWD